MAKPRKASSGEQGAGSNPPASTAPAALDEDIAALLRRPCIRAIIEREHAQAQSDLRHGPNGTGWQFNESKRAAVTELAESLHVLAAIAAS